MAEPGIAVAELRRRAALQPEEPLIFFRGEHGHFRWWSYARAARALAGEPEPTPPRPTAGAGVGLEAPRAVLAAWRVCDDGEGRLAALLLERLGPVATRDVWISWRPLERAAERVLALAALTGGWAILREPGERLPAATFAWARPTVLAGPAAELEALLAELEAEAPRTFRQRWLRRRLARLRAVVTDEDDAGATGLAARLAAMGASARVLPVPAAD